jgi:hypothetical protein
MLSRLTGDRGDILRLVVTRSMLSRLFEGFYRYAAVWWHRVT